MDYIPKAKRDEERERARWMTVGEAVEHIKVVTNADMLGALRQLGQAIDDKEVQTRQDYSDVGGEGRFHTNASFPDSFWKNISLLLRDRKERTIDWEKYIYAVNGRIIFVLREDVARCWQKNKSGEAPVAPTTPAKGPVERPRPAEQLILDAIDDIWMGKGLPRDLPRERQAIEIQEWLKTQKKPPKSIETISKAIQRHLSRAVRR